MCAGERARLGELGIGRIFGKGAYGEGDCGGNGRMSQAGGETQSLDGVEPAKAGTNLDKPLNYDKLIKLFTHPDTSTLYDRQVSQLRRVARHNPNGFPLKSLPKIQQLILLALQQLNSGQAQFTKPLTSLITLAGIPFSRDCSNEELTPNGLKSAESMYRALNTVMCEAADINLQVAATAALTEVAKGKSLEKKKAPSEIKVLGVQGGTVKNDQRPKPRDLSQSMLNKSGVVDGCVNILSRLSTVMIDRLDAMVEAGSLGYISDDSSDEEGEGKGVVSPPAPAAVGVPEGSLEGSLDTLSNPSAVVENDDSLAVASLADPEVSPRPLLMALLKLLSELSESATNATLITLTGGDVATVEIMDRLNDDRDETLNLCVEILWNCLEHSSNTLNHSSPAISRAELIKKRRTGNTMYCLSDKVGIMCKTFRNLLQRGFRNKDKETRNEVLILSSLIARNKRSHNFFLSSSFVKVMSVYATVAEVGTDPDGDGEEVSHVDPHNFATVSPADLELKRILWGLLSELSRANADILDVVVESPLIETLLMYLDTDLDGDGIPDDAMYTEPEVDEEEVVDEDGDGVDDKLQVAGVMGATGAQSIISRIPRTQLRVLQSQALMVLLNLAPRAPDKFKALGGPIVVLRFLDWCDDNPLNRELIQGALMLLISVVGLPGLQEELAQMDAIRIMLQRFNDHGSPESLRADAVRIIGRLCSRHEGNQELLRKNLGIMPLVKELEEYCKHRRIICGKPKVSATGKHQAEQQEEEGAGGSMGGSAKETISPLIVAVVDCMWSSCVGNRRSEARLLQCEGQDALLDLLEICPRLMRNQIVGLLADLMLNAKCIPYLTAWRSDRSMVSAVSLLMRLWEEEEVRMKKERVDGVITNLWRPLGPHVAGAPVPKRPIHYFNEFGLLGEDLDGDGIDDGLQTTQVDETMRQGTLVAFKKLENALAAGAKRTGGNLEAKLKKSMSGEDMRGKIGGLIECIGWEQAKENLSAHEKLTLTMVQNHRIFVRAEEWMAVRDSLVCDSTKPILADALLIGSHLEEAFNVATSVSAEQGVLYEEKMQAIENEESNFFGSILLQRDQEIHQLQIKKKASMPKSLAKRKAEKEAKAAMLAKSTIREGDKEGAKPVVEVTVIGDDADADAVEEEVGGGGEEKKE
ncbi:hypothetical protein TrLO_g13021 [Triparma laevis f. longispina]|uniref:Cilia- and flagella-associated protein 69 ARM repeats domain-containing protein n=1 Tax=Triparma laevis f. longispina TaxID=1714387 RepID=A0A9W7FID8_9STRA|nr:hypothetical protein TrLO_g13021 [Triparma laevis f. longispina]